MKLPLAKNENIVEQDLKNELLLYNLTTHQAFTLNETLKIIYQSCDGRTSFAELKQHKFTDDLIYLALAELSANGLLSDYQSNHFAGLSRREVIKKVGLTSMIALPVVIGLTMPKAAAAASQNNCPGGRCFGQGANICADCNNQTRTYFICNTTNGTCSDCTLSTRSITCGTGSDVRNNNAADLLRSL